MKIVEHFFSLMGGGSQDELMATKPKHSCHYTNYKVCIYKNPKQKSARGIGAITRA